MKTHRFKDEYPWLYITTIVLKITAILILVCAIIFITLMLLKSNSSRLSSSKYLPALYMSVSAFLSASIFFAFAELIKVIVRIELNTRHETFSHSEQSPSNGPQRNLEP